MRRVTNGPLARVLLAALLTALVASSVVAQGPAVSAVSATGATTGAPVADPARVWDHLVAFQDIADGNGGTRTTGSPGFAASEAYAATILEAAGWQVREQTVTLPPVLTVPPALAQIGPVPATYALITDFIPLAPTVSPPVVEAPLALVGIAGVPGPTDGSAACEPGAFDGFPAGAMALVVAGSCDPNLVVDTAHAAGATGVGFIPDGTPGRTDPPFIPINRLNNVFSLSHALGVSLVDQVRTVGPVTLRSDSGYRPNPATTTNIIAERPGTDPSRVLALGAHLDSVPSGPGINDNGSGASALLALAEAWGASDVTTGPTLRIGLWAAEEAGKVGSELYVNSLTADDRAAITAYLNFDMLGSRNGFPFVLDPATATKPETVSPGSDLLTERFRAYFDAAGIPTDGIWANGASDDVSFAKVGIPVGGVFPGAFQIKTEAQAAAYGGTAGEPMDACYHQACDTLDGINRLLLDQLVAGLSAVVGELAEPVAPPAPAPTPVVVTPAFTG